LKTDERVFALLDEACNKTCHTRSWRKDAESKGLAFGELVGEPRHYKGVGSRTTSGKRRIPLILRLTKASLKRGDQARLIFGDLSSNEFAEGTQPCLVSLNAQSTLGLIKDTRAGT
jgi:hypothetical protein